MTTDSSGMAPPPFADHDGLHDAWTLSKGAPDWLGLVLQVWNLFFNLCISLLLHFWQNFHREDHESVCIFLLLWVVHPKNLRGSWSCRVLLQKQWLLGTWNVSSKGVHFNLEAVGSVRFGPWKSMWMIGGKLQIFSNKKQTYCLLWHCCSNLFNSMVVRVRANKLQHEPLSNPTSLANCLPRQIEEQPKNMPMLWRQRERDDALWNPHYRCATCLAFQPHM